MNGAKHPALARILQKLIDFSLPIAIVLGIVGWRIFAPLAPLVPYLIGGMLFFTFLKLSPRSMRITPTQLIMLVLQLVLAIGSYALIRAIPLGIDEQLKEEIAQGMFICFIAPAATASATMIYMLGGSMPRGATYCLLTNVVIAFIGPLIFPIINSSAAGIPFWSTVWRIFSDVAPLIFIPLILAWGLRATQSRFYEKVSSYTSISFWLWVASLVLVLSYTVQFVVDRHATPTVLALLGLAGLIPCAIAFALGKWLGRRLEGDEITARQGLAQKNTTLAIWMAQAYLTPLSSIAPASYIIWQNTTNSYQLWRKKQQDRQLAEKNTNIKT